MRPICQFWRRFIRGSSMSVCTTENWCVENSLNLWSKQLPVWSHTVRIFVVSKSEHRTDQLSRKRYGRHSEEIPAWTRHVFVLFAKYFCCNLDRICGRKSARLGLRL